MTKRIVFIQGRRTILNAAQLIQSGGEGMVFDLKRNGQRTAIKLYHAPQAHHVAKLEHMCRLGLAQQLPPHVFTPQTLVTDKQQQVIGFEMNRLPTGTVALRQLASRRFWQQQHLTMAQVVQLLRQIHLTLQQLHQNGVIVGDLNDQNLYFSHDVKTPLQAYWIDTDSYQLRSYPCPVAMMTFLDPNLYGVPDFSQRPYFSAATDWYAYLVLVVKSLLQIHPFGGTHPQHKSIQSRAQAGITILDSAITYPANARPPEVLSDELLHLLHTTFAQGRRQMLPLHLLDDYIANLRQCTQCGLDYPGTRAHCPACRVLTPVPQPVTTGAVRELLHTQGPIIYARVLPDGRMLAVERLVDGYALHHLGRGGLIRHTPLFGGRAGYRFAAWQTDTGRNLLAVNPPQGRQLLLLDVNDAVPQQLALLETAAFRGSSVFATTPRQLYRIAGSWIMRGSFRDDHYIEEPILTAHQQQTRFWAAAHSPTLAGYHRVFAEYRFWLWHDGASFDVAIPPLSVGSSLQQVAVAFGPDSVAFMLTLREGRSVRGETIVANLQGEIIKHLPQTAVHSHYPFTTIPALATPPLQLLPPTVTVDDEMILHAGKKGLLLQLPHSLQYLTC